MHNNYFDILLRNVHYSENYKSQKSIKIIVFMNDFNWSTLESG